MGPNLNLYQDIRLDIAKVNSSFKTAFQGRIHTLTASIILCI